MQGILEQYIEAPDVQLPHTIARMFDDGQATLVDLVCVFYTFPTYYSFRTLPHTQTSSQIKAAEEPLTSTIDAQRKAITDLLAKVVARRNMVHTHAHASHSHPAIPPGAGMCTCECWHLTTA